MARIHKTLRLDEDVAARVGALKEEGESEAAAYSRVICAGVEALETPARGEGGGNQAALVSSLAEHIDTLREANEALRGQLRIKDAQIEALTGITQAAQALQGLAHRQLEDKAAGDVIEVAGDGGQGAEGKRRGFLSRLFG